MLEIINHRKARSESSAANPAVIQVGWRGALSEYAPGTGCQDACEKESLGKLFHDYRVGLRLSGSRVRSDNATSPSTGRKLRNTADHSHGRQPCIHIDEGEFGGMICDPAIPPHCFVNVQGYDCALSLEVKRRATCAFAKSFLNLINNFAAFIQIGNVSAYVSEMAGN